MRVASSVRAAHSRCSPNADLKVALGIDLRQYLAAPFGVPPGRAGNLGSIPQLH